MQKIGKIISEYPLIVFVCALLVLFGAVFIGNKSRTSGMQTDDDQVSATRSVETFDGQSPLTMEVLGEVDRADTITLVATASGIVNRIANEGTFVYKGSEIAKVADTYAGTSVSAASTAIANRALEYQEEIYDDQKTILDIQKDDLNKTDRDEIKIARKQITLQERANEFNVDNARLQAQQAGAQAARERMSAPFTGTVQSTFVRAGDNVTVGTPLAVLKAQDARDAQIVAYVGAARAANIDLTGRVLAEIEGREVELKIIHIATVPTAAGSYAVTLALSGDTSQENAAVSENMFRDGTFVNVRLPITTTDESQKIIPLDAVRYGAAGPEVFVMRDGRAVPVLVELGAVLGSYVGITAGLEASDMVILDRSVSADESVTSQ